MLPHRPLHPQQDVEGLGMHDVKFATHKLASGSSVDIIPRYRSRSRDRDRDRSRARSERPILALPIPLLNRNSRSMSAVPTRRVSHLARDEPISATPVSLNMENSRPGLGSRRPSLLAVMRRSNSYGYRRTSKGVSGRGMFSTPEERSTSASPAESRTPSPVRSTQPPSIAQIAMGLHTSRTPHLGPSHAYLSSEPGARSAAHLNARGRASLSPPPSRPATASSSTRVAAPLRSSLKKNDASRSTSPSASVSASASSIPSTPRSPFSRISHVFSGSGVGRSRLDKFLGRGTKSPMASVTSLNSSEADLGVPRKAVRFTSIIEDEDVGVGVR